MFVFILRGLSILQGLTERHGAADMFPSVSALRRPLLLSRETGK